MPSGPCVVRELTRAFSHVPVELRQSTSGMWLPNVSPSGRGVGKTLRRHVGENGWPVGGPISRTSGVRVWNRSAGPGAQAGQTGDYPGAKVEGSVELRSAMPQPTGRPEGRPRNRWVTEGGSPSLRVPLAACPPVLLSAKQSFNPVVPTDAAPPPRASVASPDARTGSRACGTGRSPSVAPPSCGCRRRRSCSAGRCRPTGS